MAFLLYGEVMLTFFGKGAIENLVKNKYMYREPTQSVCRCPLILLNLKEIYEDIENVHIVIFGDGYLRVR